VSAPGANTRAEALRLLGRGMTPAEVARELGVKAATVRQWKARAGKAAPPPQADGPGEVETLERLAQAERATAARALQAANRAIEAGKASDGRNHMVSNGIAIQRHADLLAQVHAAREHEGRMAEELAQQLAQVIRKMLSAFKIDVNARPVRELVRHLLIEGGRGGGGGDPDPEIVEAARRLLKETYVKEAMVDGLVVEPQRKLPPGVDDGPRELPPPGESDQEGEGGDEMVGPRVVVRTLRERLRNRRANGGNGELVEPTEVLPPEREGHGAVEDAAKAREDREARIHWNDDYWTPNR
jgi:hypothetical protein